MSTLTEADIETFKQCLREWQAKLNLNGWRIVFSPIPAKGVMAQMDKWDWRQRQVTCRIGLDWKSTPVNKHTLEQTAVHELLHVAVFELIQLAQTPGISQDDLLSAEHGFINMMEANLVPGERS